MIHTLEIIDITPNSNLNLSKKEFLVDFDRLWFTKTHSFHDQEFNTISLTEGMKELVAYKISQQDNCFYVKLIEKEYKSICEELDSYIKIRFKFVFKYLIYLGVGIVYKYEIKSKNISLTMTNSKYYRNNYHI